MKWTPPKAGFLTSHLSDQQLFAHEKLKSWQARIQEIEKADEAKYTKKTFELINKLTSVNPTGPNLWFVIN